MKLAAKTWCLLFCGIGVLAVIFLILLNSFASSLNFFDDFFSNSYYGQNADLRRVVLHTKARYIRENPTLYNGFIVGGSRTGVLDPAIASRYTGLSFYNFSFSQGSQDVYEEIIDFLIENTAVKQIILQLNGQEVLGYVKRYDKAIYASESRLITAMGDLRDILFASIGPDQLKAIFEKPLNNPKIHENGMIDTIELYAPEERLDPDLIGRKLLPSFQNEYKKIFIDRPYWSYRGTDPMLASLRRIKNKCIANNIEFTLLMAPTSPAVLSLIESPFYWECLRSISEVTDYYNFNGFSKYNFNPYDFADGGHYRREMGDKMLHIIFGQEPAGDDDWGILLTRDTIDAYLERRKNTYLELKKLYEETGAMVLGDMTDASFIPLKEY
ncbi:MAG: hypothetical protein LBQ88_10610 [Treponema sp.]|jgi:hypothetical protein|nr:hypothetical protein [Treponema sp.]